MSHSLDPSPTSTTDVAKDGARSVGQTTSKAASQVAGTAADQARDVTQETRRQAQDLLAQGRSQATEQARTGQQKAAEGLTALAEEMRGMTGGEGSGPAHDLVAQATGVVDTVAGHLRDREPADLLEDARRYARRRPGMFLLGAAVAGVVAGRLTTGVIGAHKDTSGTSTPAAPTTPAPPVTAATASPDVPLVGGYTTVPPTNGTSALDDLPVRGGRA